MTSLTVLVPVYDEQHLVAASLELLEVLEKCMHLDRIQVIVVDVFPRDETADAIATFARAHVIELAFARPSTCGASAAPASPDSEELGPLLVESDMALAVRAKRAGARPLSRALIARRTALSLSPRS